MPLIIIASRTVTWKYEERCHCKPSRCLQRASVDGAAMPAGLATNFWPGERWLFPHRDRMASPTESPARTSSGGAEAALRPEAEPWQPVSRRGLGVSHLPPKCHWVGVNGGTPGSGSPPRPPRQVRSLLGAHLGLGPWSLPRPAGPPGEPGEAHPYRQPSAQRCAGPVGPK